MISHSFHEVLRMPDTKCILMSSNLTLIITKYIVSFAMGITPTLQLNLFAYSWDLQIEQ